MKFTLEICVESVQPALEAINAGAGRIELCSSLSEGGITPSPGLIKLAAEKFNVPVHVIIRPRGGDFLYSDIEYETMKADIEFCKTLRIAGIVTGILKADGNVDVERTGELVRLAAPMTVTFHRAFDMCFDPYSALEDVIETGATRILTSGCRNKAPDGLDIIAGLVKRAGDRIIIMPGSGLNDSNIEIVAKTTRANEFHMSAGKFAESGMVFRKDGISMGGSGLPEYSIKTVDGEKIMRVIKILENVELNA
jgi:copper homeostasis protein